MSPSTTRTIANVWPVLVAVLMFIGPITPAFAEPLVPNKRGYHLFNPTPVSQMREFVTDRPDKTESAYTVDAGHVQFETDVFTYVHDKDIAGNLTESTVFDFINLKAGLATDLDLQILIQSFQATSFTPRGGMRENMRGFGDLTIRLKYNIMGNDAGTVALGAMPFVTLPTGVTSPGASTEGGAAFMVAIALPKDFGLGGMVQVVRGDDWDFVGSVSLGHDIVGDLAGYVELFGQTSLRPTSSFVATFDCGLTYAVTPNWQLDAGVNVGMTAAADDLNPFLGLSGRL